jgi:hypothetical protein
MKTYHLRLNQDQIDALLMGLRYLELSHPITPENEKMNYRAEFMKLLRDIDYQLSQTTYLNDE